MITDPRAAEASERGIAAVRAQAWPEAVAAFLEAVQWAPGDVRNWYNLANARMRQGDHYGAAAACVRALAIDPKYPNLQLLTGNAYAELSQYFVAVEHYLCAVEQEPRQMIISINLAVAFERMNLHEEAYECYDTAIMLGADRSTCLSAMYYTASQACRWDLTADVQARFDQYLDEGGENRAAPFQLLTMDSTRVRQLEAARAYAKQNFTKLQNPPVL